ncbi:MAG: 50S ribosomal protein L11 methyltransferase [Ignavibacteria bacterium]|nr:50S ribosomal protein L11 methyltransferase [Ignavibacteria bacterium]
MATRYVLLTLAVHDEDLDLIMGVLSGYPIMGVEQGMDQITVCFEQNDWQEPYASAIPEEIASLGLHVAVITQGTEEDQNWNAEWEASIDPVVVNERIVIVPEWRAHEYNLPLTLNITPKMSFGTGHHATTRMMCKLTEQYVQADEKWIDVGTGTGVLAILAARLGASHVFAFDNNEWSIVNSRENIERNGVQDKISLQMSELQETALPPCDGLAANLYRHLVIPYASVFIASVKPGGIILVSGILKYDFDEVAEPFVERGCLVEESLAETEWCAIAFRTPSAGMAS